MSESLVQTRVQVELDRCIAIANQRYPEHKFKHPKVKFDLKGTCAGTAHDRSYTINLNMIIMIDNMHSIEDTTAHEFAHLVDGLVNPHTRQTRRASSPFGSQRSKRSIHGSTWKNIMVMFGMKPERCHSLDTSRASPRSAKSQSSKIHVWVCGCGQGQVVITPLRHKQMLTYAHDGYGVYKRGHTPNRCGNYTYQGVQSTTQLPVAAKSSKPTTTPAKKSTSGSITKIDKCRALYALHIDMTRGEIITRFVNDASCTQAGAQTYYAKITKEMSA